VQDGHEITDDVLYAKRDLPGELVEIPFPGLEDADAHDAGPQHRRQVRWSQSFDVLITIAKHWTNALVDMCWSWIINPIAAKYFLKKYLVMPASLHLSQPSVELIRECLPVAGGEI
jgi:hypothetical protein